MLNTLGESREGGEIQLSNGKATQKNIHMQRVDSLMEEAAMIFFLKMARRDKFKGVS